MDGFLDDSLQTYNYENAIEPMHNNYENAIRLCPWMDLNIA